VADASSDHIRIQDGRILSPIPKKIAAMLRGSRVELILHADWFLLRPLDLPKQAGEFLEGIIRSQIDRLTPWSGADAAFGWSTPTEAAKGRITLTVVATARALVLPYVEALTPLGVKSIVVSTFPGEARGSVPIEILWQRSVGALDTGKVRRALVAVLLLAVLLMGLADAADQIVASNLDAQKSGIERRIAEHRSITQRDGSGGASSVAPALERRKHEMPSSVVVLEALSQILPDHTYATELRVEGDKLQVVGVTHDAPSLIQLIEQSPHFKRAIFLAPTTRSPGDPGERFHIEARIEPLVSVR